MTARRVVGRGGGEGDRDGHDTRCVVHERQSHVDCVRLQWCCTFIMLSTNVYSVHTSKRESSHTSVLQSLRTHNTTWSKAGHILAATEIRRVAAAAVAAVDNNAKTRASARARGVFARRVF